MSPKTYQASKKYKKIILKALQICYSKLLLIQPLEKKIKHLQLDLFSTCSNGQESG